MIKKEDLKKCQIVCRNQNQVKDCLDYLKQLGFDVEDFAEYCDGCNIIFYGDSSKKFIISNMLKRNLPIEFYNKKLIKTLQKFIKEKEEQEKEKKEKIEDIEVASDGRVMKINNYKCKEYLYFLVVDFDNENRDDPVGNGSEILHCNYDSEEIGFDKLMEYGLLFKNDEALDRHLFKLKIETQLKNIAERLNAGRKIDWENYDQSKFGISYDYKCKELSYYINGNHRPQATIYCLDKNFLNVAKQEIGEDNLIKYFKEDLN